jgi:outer membrane protein assembly factor BamB
MSDIASHVQPAPLQPDPTLSSASPAAPPRLRLWPGVLAVGVQWLVMTVPPLVAPDNILAFMIAKFYGPIVGMLGVAVWWLFFSRLRWADRLLGLAAFAVISAGAICLLHPGFRAMGPMIPIIFILPWLPAVWVGWLVVTFFLSWPVRRAGLLLVFLAAWGYFVCLRMEEDGVTGSFTMKSYWRWTPTAEQKFLAELAARPRSEAGLAALDALQPSDWPAFRGPDRDGRRTGVHINADWQNHPPRQVWRHRVGPGWSSFAVVGQRVFTQEQRDDQEVVVCYHADTGEELWSHQDATRFSEFLGGDGPRSTPTYHDGKIYALGAKGQLNCLDAVKGNVVWSRNIASDSGAEVPMWGFSSSPLVLQGVVTVFTGAPNNKSVQGYDAATGEPVWAAGEGKQSYCSPERLTLDGVEQVVIATEVGVTSFEPTKGKVLWQHAYDAKGMARITQPALVDSNHILIGTGMMAGGARRIQVDHAGDNWTTEEKWTTTAIKPYFNDLVVHQGNLYGFDNNYFTCVSLTDGKRRWRERGYGNGQVLLLADQSLLLVLTEEGEVALVEAKPEKHNELARFKAIEGKTWNHPVVANGKLFVRNGEEAACYELPGFIPGGMDLGGAPGK